MNMKKNFVKIPAVLLGLSMITCVYGSEEDVGCDVEMQILKAFQAECITKDYEGKSTSDFILDNPHYVQLLEDKIISDFRLALPSLPNHVQVQFMNGNSYLSPNLKEQNMGIKELRETLAASVEHRSHHMTKHNLLVDNIILFGPKELVKRKGEGLDGMMQYKGEDEWNFEYLGLSSTESDKHQIYVIFN